MIAHPSPARAVPTNAYDPRVTDQWVRSADQQAIDEAQAIVDAQPSADIIVRRYPGVPEAAVVDFKADAAQMIPAGWYPIAQQFISDGPGVARVATLGVLALAGTPAGELIVTWQYERSEAPAPPDRPAAG
jgi:hypothetical protein